MHNEVVNSPGFDDVAETASINVLGQTTRQRTDGVNRTIQFASIAEQGARRRSDAPILTVESRDRTRSLERTV